MSGPIMAYFALLYYAKSPDFAYYNMQTGLKTA